MDKATATKYHFAVADRVLINLPSRPQTFTITGIVTFGNDNNLAGVTLAGFDQQTAQSLFNSRGDYNSISVLAAPGADNVKLQLAIARILPPGVRGSQRANRRQRALQRGRQRALVHLDGTADLRGHLAVRRRVHDLQHVLDHRWSTDPRAGAAAHCRREPPPDLPVGVGGGRTDGAGGLADRAGARGPGRARPQGPPEGVRHRAAVRAPGVRDPHCDCCDRGWRRRYRDLGDRPRPSRRADCAGGRAGGSQRRSAAVVAAPARDRRTRRAVGRRRLGPRGARRASRGTGGPRRGRRVHRHRHARPDHRAAARWRPRTPAGRPARDPGKARP